MRVLSVGQVVAAGVVAGRLARGRARPAPLRAGVAGEPAEAISVVIPARDEEARLQGCLVRVLADPAVSEVIVVDDESRDGTAGLAAELGATVVTGAPLPDGWVGKQWALHQGVQAAKGPVVVLLDADTRPEAGVCAELAALLDRYDLVSVGPRFICDGVAEQALHASLLATLVYRFGPVGPAAPSAGRLLVNGQCMAFRKARMVEADGFARVRGHLTDDVALGRLLARDGWRVGFLDAGPLLGVDMHESAAAVWREWGRSISLRDVTPAGRLVMDVATVWLTAALPVLRAAMARPTPLDLALLAQRFLLVAALRGSYARPGLGLALSPLLDVAAAVRLTRSALSPARAWRGRGYGREAVMSGGPPGRPVRSAAR
ncbi:glycosyltransferase [Actinomadura madurae]|uniref:glycosyltransferase n=1 Tax=Actinomadura madurae TaxID=1993 RepID=UPI0020D2202D|nr:glycosyltransferase family 2 protein [Actinomadura madurae]MCP9951796.1 glycosyltransferase family 2 protein [Actinomadura madurae]MCP9981036.1 glycosyltransferase family 2 protein [Actinomadura madurae]MCQ0007463.1 glycosyltransferase family 2 protein [Actinomadura madurae]MCQ0017233.1 glycosyltransferase family 2 protein [Actinomadura madurae]